MGQDQSTEPRDVSIEELSREIALKFATRCYTELELYCFKQVFKSLADSESGLRYWTEQSQTRFLQLPDVLGAGPVLYQMSTYLGAFPFASQSPSILTVEAQMKVVTLMTHRYKKVLKRGSNDRLKLFYRSLAVYDRRISEVATNRPGLVGDQTTHEQLAETLKGVSGFQIDEPAGDEADDEEEEDDDELALAALDSLDAIEAVGFAERPAIRKSIIPADNFLKLTELLLYIAPLGAQESLSIYADRLNAENVEGLRKVAASILNSFNVQEKPGIDYKTFEKLVPNSLPYIFEGLSPLFEHFLFDKNFDLAKRRSSHSEQPSSPSQTYPMSPTSPTSPAASFGLPTSPKLPSSPRSPKEEPLSPMTPLLPEGGELLNTNTLSQLAFFIEPSQMFYRLHKLYSGNEHGFSMGSFEKAVFTWKAPTILLVSGTLLGEEPSNSRERVFAESLQSKRYPNSLSHLSKSESRRVTYGAFVTQPWKQTHRECMGDASTVLFQLDPVHDVFRASELRKDYVTFTVPPSTFPGIGFGSPLAGKTPTHHVNLGPVSLFLNDALEFGVFTHTASGGGSFHNSLSPVRYANPPVPSHDTSDVQASHNTEARPGDWQDRFEIDSLEVWGCGGNEVAARQRRELDFEEREAKLRREGRASISGGVEADREILRMAGLIGHRQEGGSMV